MGLISQVKRIYSTDNMDFELVASHMIEPGWLLPDQVLLHVLSSVISASHLSDAVCRDNIERWGKRPSKLWLSLRMERVRIKVFQMDKNDFKLIHQCPRG